MDLWRVFGGSTGSFDPHALGPDGKRIVPSAEPCVGPDTARKPASSSPIDTVAERRTAGQTPGASRLGAKGSMEGSTTRAHAAARQLANTQIPAQVATSSLALQVFAEDAIHEAMAMNKPGVVMLGLAGAAGTSKSHSVFNGCRFVLDAAPVEVDLSQIKTTAYIWGPNQGGALGDFNLRNHQWGRPAAVVHFRHLDDASPALRGELAARLAKCVGAGELRVPTQEGDPRSWAVVVSGRDPELVRAFLAEVRAAAAADGAELESCSLVQRTALSRDEAQEIVSAKWNASLAREVRLPEDVRDLLVETALRSPQGLRAATTAMSAIQNRLCAFREATPTAPYDTNAYWASPASADAPVWRQIATELHQKTEPSPRIP